MSAAIRLFAPPDRVALGEAIDTVCAESPWMSTPCFQPTPAWTHALGAPTCPHHLLLVAEDEGKIVGWCRLFPLVGCNGQATEAELGIGLLPGYRGCGLGKSLVSQALDWAAERGMKCVTLAVRVANLRAIRLFERCGFKTTNRETDGWMEMACQPLMSGGKGNG